MTLGEAKMVKVGDSVRLRKGLEVGRKYGGRTLFQYMVFDGSKTITEDIYVTEEYTSFCCLPDNCSYTRQMLELVKS